MQICSCIEFESSVLYLAFNHGLLALITIQFSDELTGTVSLASGLVNW